MKQGWEIKNIGSIADITDYVANGSFATLRENVSYLNEEGYAILVRLADYTNGFDSSKFVYIDEHAYNFLAKSKLYGGEIIMSNVGSIGKCFKCPDLNKPMSLAPNSIVIRTPNNDFYHYVFQSFYFQSEVKRISSQTALPKFNKTSFKNINVPIPPRDEQERIVAELDCLSGVIEKKREQLRELDVLAQSIFYQMFGDPITNEKGFPVYKIDDIITFQGGSQPDKSHFEYEPTDDNIRLIQIRDYKSDKNITYIPKSLARRLCNAEDIMIGRYGPPIFQILKGIEGAYNVALMKAIPKQGNREFIRAFLKQKCLLEYLESMSKRTAGQDGIQMDKLKAYPFPLPPIELQEEFANKIALIEKQQELIKMSIAQTEELFNSRMAYYFN